MNRKTIALALATSLLAATGTAGAATPIDTEALWAESVTATVNSGLIPPGWSIPEGNCALRAIDATRYPNYVTIIQPPDFVANCIAPLIPPVVVKCPTVKVVGLRKRDVRVDQETCEITIDLRWLRADIVTTIRTEIRKAARRNPQRPGVTG